MEDQCVIDREIRGVQSRTQDRIEGLTDVDYEILYDISIGLTDKAISLRRKLSTRGVQGRLQSLYEKLMASEDEQGIELYSTTFNTWRFEPR
jgi:DNA-binding NarL/FixJ family response regulator